MNVVITGSARGLGFEMAKCFRKKNYNVIISDMFKIDLDNAKKKLLNVNGKGEVDSFICDITKEKDVCSLIKKVVDKYGIIDIWINNAGINQPDKMIWELKSDDISKMVDVDLKSTMIVSKYVIEVMSKQDNGAIYNVEGHGSNDAYIPGLSIYGTAKRGVTYFTQALAKEVEMKKLDIIVGRLSPGIMITDFLVNSFRNNKIELSTKNKKIYNILGDKPDIVAKFLVNGIISNTDNNKRIEWLTKRRVIFKFIRALYKKNDYFNEKN